MSNIKEITAKELRDKLLSGEKILMIDVRSKDEYINMYIENSFLMELPLFNQTDLEQKCRDIDNLKKVVFICKSGFRSRNAINLLENFPYEAYNLIGGISAWAGLGYSLVMDFEK